MGYGMKYTKGGFPFKSAPTKMHEGKVHKPVGDDGNNDNFDDQSRKFRDLPNLSGTTGAEEVDLSKKSGLGPRNDFGGVKNPELDPSREAEDTAE